MQKTTDRNQYPGDILVSFAVLLILIVYTYGILFVAPYPGFYVNPPDGQILEIYEPQGNKLEVGDFIESINSISFEEYRTDKTLDFFEGIQPGQHFEIVVQRKGNPVTVDWVFPSSHRPGFLGRFFNIWWLSYVFWLIGSSTQLFMRPKDTKWRLFVANNYLSGLFIMFGAGSSLVVMGSAVLMRVVAWLLLPLYIHFHWIFPKPFRRVPQWLKIAFYILFCGIAVAELFMLLPNSLYFLAVVLAFGGSIVLLVFHYILQPEHRRELRALAIASFVSLFLIVLIGLIGSVGNIPYGSPLALFALPILPITYFYVLYRQSLGGLELRANRTISLYTFLVLLGIALMLVVSFSGVIAIDPKAFLFAIVLIALATTFFGVQVFPAFQSWVERRLLRIKLPAQNMVADFSDRIVASTTLDKLLKLLQEDVFPSLFVRQYAFVQIADESAKILLLRDVASSEVSNDSLLEFLASAPTGGGIPLSTVDSYFGWVRLVLPLKIGDKLVGAWLLGRRDPDDRYPQAELPILQSLANQTAIALSYILQTERLKVMYEANINRYEQERLRLGHELHDSLLNEMAAMLMKHDPDALPKDFQESYDGLIVRLREIVTDLRPPMLVYGLKYALDGLADNLSERNHDVVKVISELQAMDQCRYPESVEHNIYRIVQESCENALKYAQAKSIHITGELSLNRIELQVIDDGVGLKDGISHRLEDIIANKHYGLAGMHERAELVGATLKFESETGKGTRIYIYWTAVSA